MAEATGEMHSIALTLVVSDLQKSTRFYCEGLGFSEGETLERGDEAAATLELASCKFSMRFLARADTRLMLIKFHEPAASGDGSRKPSTSLGPLLISFTCPDPRSVAAKLVGLGGELVRDGASANGKSALCVVTDPDGFRVEINSVPINNILELFKLGG